MHRRLTYAFRVGGLALRHPVEAYDRVKGRLELAQWPVAPDPATPERSDAWKAALHRQLNAPWPCPEMTRYEQVYADMVERLGVGRHHDSDPNLGLTMACVTRHLRAERVVEVGVARGISSRLTLEALADNGTGRLFSIDLPYQLAEYQGHVGLAVPAELRDRWQLIRGSSSRKLRPLLDELGTIQVFMRDTLPTPPTVLRELDAAWAHLVPGGVAIAQDIHKSSGFAQFVDRARPRHVLSIPQATSAGTVGVAWK